MVKLPFLESFTSFLWAFNCSKQTRVACLFCSKSIVILMALFHFNEFDFKDQGFIWANAAARTPFTVGQVGRDKHFPGGAGRHHGQNLLPALDHAIDRKGGGFSPFVGAVKFSAVD